MDVNWLVNSDQGPLALVCEDDEGAERLVVSLSDAP